MMGVNSPHGMAGTQMQRNIPKALLGIALVIYIFNNSEVVALASQLAALLLIATSAAILYFKNPQKYKLSTIELVLFSICVLSIASCVIQRVMYDENTLYSAFYTLISAATFGAISVISRNLSMENLLNVAAAAFSVILFLIFYEFHSDIQLGLMANSGRWSTRIHPFGMHSNLAGFVMGAGFIVLVYKAGETKSHAIRLLSLIGSAGCLAIILAASNRSAVVALLGGGAWVMIKAFRYFPHKLKQISVFSSLPMFAIAGFYFKNIYEYISVILELDSKARGFGSGATGRVELWAQGMDLLASSPLNFLIGSGLRSTGFENIGFMTESSYISIMLESGVIMGAVFVISLIYAVIDISNKIRSERGKIDSIFALYLVVYVLIQSIFTRYLLGIGNTLSIFFLMVVVRVSAQVPAKPPRVVASSSIPAAVVRRRARLRTWSEERAL